MDNQRRTIKLGFWLSQIFAPLYYLTGYLMNAYPKQPYTVKETPYQLPFTIFALFVGILAMYWFVFRVKTSLPNKKFQKAMMSGLLFSAVVAFSGFVIFIQTRNLGGLPPFIIASLLINFIFCAPKVLTR